MNKGIRTFLLISLLLICVFGISAIIQANSTEKTTIICEDEKMYDALVEALKNYISIGDANKIEKTIKIPTDDINDITSINLDHKEITNIKGIEALTKLEEISLAKNYITNIEPLQNLNNVTFINLSNNSNLGNKANSILSTKVNLKKLHLSNIGLSDIGFLSNLNQLEELNIAYGSFNNLTAIENTQTLINLDVSNNRSITELDYILNLNGLQKLNISNTGINKIELDYDRNIGIYNLTNLKELNISGLDLDNTYAVTKNYYNEHHHKNEYDEWEGDYSAFLEKLEVLDMGYINKNENNYVGMPSFYELSLLKNLRKLYMQGNNLTDINSIYLLNELEEINLENNKISDLSELVLMEEQSDEFGNSHNARKAVLKADSIDLSDNEINDISVFNNMQDVITNARFLDLSSNHIYNSDYIENCKGAINLRSQVINMPVYKKVADTDQYIFLLPILKNAKNSNSILYSATARYIPVGCKINEDPSYQEVDSLNVIISNSKMKNYSDENQEQISISLSGGIADGSIINYCINSEYDSIDSILFFDDNLKMEIYNALRKSENIRFFISRGNIININHNVISEIDRLNLANKNISNIAGLENFDGLRELSIAQNTSINSIEPLKFCNQMEILNASETSIGNNYSAIEEMGNLKVLRLNNVGMTNINIINNVTAKKHEEYQETTLEELDLSANNLQNVNGVGQITSLRVLTVNNNNNISELPDLSALVNLERLNAYANKITRMPIISDSNLLNFVLLSNNKLENISELKKVTSLIQLDISNNLLDDEDISELNGIKINQVLKIAGNAITNVLPIRDNLSRVSELDISNNKISDMSLIDDRFSQNGTLTANNQKLCIVLEQNSQGEVLIDLPQIFVASKTRGSYFYTESDFETHNCTISDSKIRVNITELGQNVATVKISGGLTKDTILSIVAPIDVQINYSTNDWTKDNVTAIILFNNRNNVTIKNNSGNNQYVFTSNGEFIFEYIDEYGIQGNTKARVSWIDKIPPLITGVGNNITYEDVAVTPIITDNHQLGSITLTKDGNVVSNYASGKQIIEYGNYVLVAQDSVGNEARVAFIIKEKQRVIPEEPEIPEETFTSETYLIDDENKIVDNINLNTTVGEFRENTKSTSSYKIFNTKGQELTNDKYIGTGCKIVTSVGEFTAIIRGDLNGTGILDLNDLGQVQKIILQLLQTDEIKTLAGDLNANKRIDLNDLARLQKILLGIKN